MLIINIGLFFKVLKIVLKVFFLDKVFVIYVLVKKLIFLLFCLYFLRKVFSCLFNFCLILGKVLDWLFVLVLVWLYLRIGGINKMSKLLDFIIFLICLLFRVRG